jgi:hypothetical protein
MSTATRRCCRTTVPCDINQVTDLEIDTENAVWYLMSDDSTLYRRAADGSWTKTASPGGKIVLAGGTVHLVTSGWQSVRRVGTQWSQPIVPPPLGDLTARFSQLAIDACWAPHIAAAHMYDVNYLFEMDYTRWTSRGFLTLRRMSTDYPDIAVAVTPGHTFIHGGGFVVVLPSH